MIAIRVAAVRLQASKIRRVVARAAALRVVSALLLTTALGGCALFGGGGDEDPLGAEPVGTTPAAESDVEAAAQAALAAAQQAWRGGDPLGAMSIATRALREGVPSEYEAPLRALRAQAREALVDEQVARLDVLPERDAVTDGGRVRATVRVRNLSIAPLTVPATAADSSVSQIVIEIQREDWDLYGNVRTSEQNLRVPLTRDLVVPPGGYADVAVEVPPSDTRLAHTGFAVLRIGGHLRAVAIRVGGTEFFDRLELEPAFVRVFMNGWEQLAAEPLRSLELAIAKRSPPHILTCAELLAPGERRAARDFLLAAAEEDPPLAFACRAGAARLKRLLDGEPQ